MWAVLFTSSRFTFILCTALHTFKRQWLVKFYMPVTLAHIYIYMPYMNVLLFTVSKYIINAKAGGWGSETLAY